MKKYRDTGVGIKASCLVVRYLFDVLGIRKLEAICYGYNERGLRMYDRLLEKEGVKREHIVWCGQAWDCVIFGLTVSDYANRRDEYEKILKERIRLEDMDLTTDTAWPYEPKPRL